MPAPAGEKKSVFLHVTALFCLGGIEAWSSTFSQKYAGASQRKKWLFKIKTAVNSSQLVAWIVILEMYAGASRRKKLRFFAPYRGKNSSVRTALTLDLPHPHRKYAGASQQKKWLLYILQWPLHVCWITWHATLFAEIIEIIPKYL